jgi:TPR repeat protein
MALPAPKKAAAQSPAVALPAKKTEAALSQATATPSSNAEQVQKLWQDVKQRKPEALVSLATIYARGEGVARDCGQASVLTEAAIRRAPQRAAELRQSLQQAGCE